MKKGLVIAIVVVGVAALAAGAYVWYAGDGDDFEQIVRGSYDDWDCRCFFPDPLPEEVARANNRFALNLYGVLKDADEERGNMFFSPYGIFTSLGMLHEGARGQTADEIRSVLDLSKNLRDNDVRWRSVGDLRYRIQGAGEGYTLDFANALWAQEGSKLRDDFVGRNLVGNPATSHHDVEVEQVGFGVRDLVATTAHACLCPAPPSVSDSYDVEVGQVDFSARDVATTTINDWVAEKTQGKITDFFNEDAFTQDTRLVLSNAVYFKGDWTEPFDEALTEEVEFQIRDGESVMVPTMQRTRLDKESFYAETEEVKMLELPYGDGSLSMLIVLPKEKGSLAAAENLLTVATLEEWKRQLQEQPVYTYLPRFSLDTRFSLNEFLQSMGISSAFIPEVADLSGISESGGLFVESAVHQAIVEVNEKGTEAAAATGIGVGITSVPAEPPTPKIFRANHPFMFLIQDRETGTILFMGRVADPTDAA